MELALKENLNLYTIEETYKGLGISRPTLFNRMKNNKIKKTKIGSNTRFKEVDIINHLIETSDLSEKEAYLFFFNNLEKPE